MLRIVDANLNRLRESLRLLEDIARFTLNDPLLSSELKRLRHQLTPKDLTAQVALLSARNAEEDVGAFRETSEEGQRDALPSVVLANAKRAQEALRVLEELGKDAGLRLDWNAYKHARFRLYTLEQALLSGVLRKSRVAELRGLYVIVDHQACGSRGEEEIAGAALRGGARVIQLRDKARDKGQVLPVARRLRDLCTQAGALFIVNDHADLALACHAHGLHLGQHDLPIEEARRMLPIDVIVGTSVDTLEEGLRAQAEGADYIAVGSVFPTVSKADAVHVGLATFAKIREALSVPVVAIGGITIENLPQVVQAGAESAAVISAVAGASDPEDATRRLVAIFEQERRKGKHHESGGDSAGRS